MNGFIGFNIHNLPQNLIFVKLIIYDENFNCTGLI